MGWGAVGSGTTLWLPSQAAFSLYSWKIKPQIKTHIRSLLDAFLRSPTPVAEGTGTHWSGRVMSEVGKASHSLNHPGTTPHSFGRNSSFSSYGAHEMFWPKPYSERETFTNILLVPNYDSFQSPLLSLLSPSQRNAVVSHSYEFRVSGREDGGTFIRKDPDLLA